jgi:hypothetical protein
MAVQRQTAQLKVHLHEIFCSRFLHLSNTYSQIMRLLIVFDFVLEFAELFKFFNIRRQVRLHVNRVNAE